MLWRKSNCWKFNAEYKYDNYKLTRSDLRKLAPNNVGDSEWKSRHCRPHKFFSPQRILADFGYVSLQTIALLMIVKFALYEFLGLTLFTISNSVVGMTSECVNKLPTFDSVKRTIRRCKSRQFYGNPSSCAEIIIPDKYKFTLNGYTQQLPII